MSGPLKMTPHQVKHLGEFSSELTKLSRLHNVFVDSYGSESVKVGDCHLAITWDGDEYVVDDRIGS